jgi:Ala-tRNA(Pro) deacylase
MADATRSIPSRLRALLEERGVAYEELHHPRDFTAQETAEHTHTPGREFAKAVVVRSGSGYALAVVPSNHRVDLEKMAALLDGPEAELASEEEIRNLCDDCDFGAVPPFGQLYGMSVLASPALARCDRITCVAGTHEDAIRLSWRDFVRLARPQIADISDVAHGRPAPGPASAHA